MNRAERRKAAHDKSAKPPRKPPREYFHVLHACGHAVYWSDGLFGMRVAYAPCPWCGGETGVNPVPQHVNLHSGLADDPAQAHLFCFREFLPGRLVPWPADMDPGDDQRIMVRHMTGDVCCITPGMEAGGTA